MPLKFTFLFESPLKTELEAFLTWLLDQERYHEEFGYSYWPFDHDLNQLEDIPANSIHSEEPPMCSICTNGAIMVAKKFHGKVMGYAERVNPTARAGKPGDEWHQDGNNGGHDFAVVGNFIVDYWIYHFTSDHHRGVFDMSSPADAAEIRHLYGDPALWVPLRAYDFTSPVSSTASPAAAHTSTPPPRSPPQSALP